MAPSIDSFLSTPKRQRSLLHRPFQFIVVLCTCLIQFSRMFTTNIFIYIHVSSSSQVAWPSPAAPQNPSTFSSRCLLPVARSVHTQSPLWTPRNLPRSANRPTVERRFLLLPLISRQMDLKAICRSRQGPTTMLITA